MPDNIDISALVARAQAEARAEATRGDGTVDVLAEAVAFRRLMVEAASADSAEPPSGG